MEPLNSSQVDRVNDELILYGATYGELREGLLDHVCCMVEELIESEALDFDQAFERAIKQFDLSQIRIIQESTLYLLNTKINNMKKTVGIIGILTALMTIFGVVFKLNHWPGANILLVLGLAITSLVVFPLMMYLTSQSIGDKTNKLLSVFGYGAGMLIILGALFKVMHWPLASIVLGIGAVILLFVFMPMYTVQSYRMAENKIFALSKSLLIAAGIIVVFGISGLRKAKSIPIHHDAAQSATIDKH